MDTNFTIVEMLDVPPNETLLFFSVIKSVIRVYSSKPRAETDLDLIRAIDPERQFAIIEVPYID